HDALRQMSFYDTPLPLVGRSPAQLFTYVERFEQAVEAALADPQGTLQSIEAAIEQRLGITDNNSLPFREQAFALCLQGQVLRLHIGLDDSITTSADFQLNLAELKRLLPADAQQRLTGLDQLVGAQGSGALSVAAYIDGDLELGLDTAPVAQGHA